MQTQTQTQPAAAPTQAPAPVTVTTPGPDGTTQTLTIPTTTVDIQALFAQRSELADQLSNVTSRRQNLSEEIRSAPEGASRTGLEDRLRLLDQRIIQLETDLSGIGRKLSAAAPELVAATEGENQGGDHFDDGMLVGGFSVLLLFPLALLYARRRWRKGIAKGSGQAPAASSDRFERLEQGIEAIAIEVERVSEGQRFVTRLLSESPAPVGASHRVKQPVAIESGEGGKGP